MFTLTGYHTVPDKIKGEPFRLSINAKSVTLTDHSVWAGSMVTWKAPITCEPPEYSRGKDHTGKAYEVLHFRGDWVRHASQFAHCDIQTWDRREVFINLYWEHDHLRSRAPSRLEGESAIAALDLESQDRLAALLDQLSQPRLL